MVDMLDDAVCVCVCVCVCAVKEEVETVSLVSMSSCHKQEAERERERESWRSDCIITVSLAELVISLSCQQEVAREEKRTNHPPLLLMKHSTDRRQIRLHENRRDWIQT